MSLLDDSKRSGGSGKGCLLLLIPFLIFLAFLFNWSEWEMRYRNSQVTEQKMPADFIRNTRLISRGELTDQNLHSRIFQLPFSQKGYTSGRSPDELAIQFDKPVTVRGLLLSVDCWKSTRLVEFAMGINQAPAYEVSTENDMLFHASFATNTTAGKIDEHIWFPHPVKVGATDSLTVGAWIQNISPDKQSVSPEIIVYYTWDEEVVKRPKRRYRSRSRPVVNPVTEEL